MANLMRNRIVVAVAGTVVGGLILAGILELIGLFGKVVFSPPPPLSAGQGPVVIPCKKTARDTVAAAVFYEWLLDALLWTYRVLGSPDGSPRRRATIFKAPCRLVSEAGDRRDRDEPASANSGTHPLCGYGS